MDGLAFFAACVAVACVILYLAKGQTAVTGAYASFSSTQTQTVTGETILTYNTDDIAPVNISRTSTSAVVLYSGTYKVLGSVQIDKTDGGTATVDMYPLVNGIAVANSATKLNVNKSGEDIMTVEWFLDLSANAQVSLALYSAAAGFRARAIAAAPPVPAIPSIILTIVKIG
jgi:hypothetical protein